MKENVPYTISANEGESLSIVGDTYRILIDGQQTGGAFATMEFHIPPGGGPGPHSHPDFFESFYVLDGEVEVRSEAGTYTATKGSFVTIPKGGLVHGFSNKTTKNAMMICTVVPAGLEDFFRDIGQRVAIGEFLPPPSMDDPAVKEKMDAAAKKYGQKVYPPDYMS